MSTPGLIPRIAIVAADTDARLDAARSLFEEYGRSLAIDLEFQGFADELRSLPGGYAAPSGRLLLAFVDDAPAGCGALRARDVAGHANACEMKRLYVRPAFRGFGLGQLLAARLLDEARDAGYASMLLDTLDAMASARALYARLGFEEIAPYYANPIAGTRYLKAILTPRAA